MINKKSIQNKKNQGTQGYKKFILAKIWHGPNSKKTNHLLTAASSLCLSLVLSLSCVSPSYAEDSNKTKLSKLEQKYFQHNYSSDQTNERLERIEKLVFGEARTGNEEERINNLVNLVPDLDSQINTASSTNSTQNQDSLDSSNSSSTNKKAHRTKKSNSNNKPENNFSDSIDSAKAPDSLPTAVDQKSSQSFNSSEQETEIVKENENSYPAVTAIEKKILGKDYVGEKIGKRLDRLEIKAFGKTNASDDLQDRVDHLRSSTGVDISKQRPVESDWAEEDDDGLSGPVPSPLPSSPIVSDDGIQPFTGLDKDQAQNTRSHRRQAPDMLNYNSGTYGAGLGSSSNTRKQISNGLNTLEDMPEQAPDYGLPNSNSNNYPKTATSSSSVTGLGLSQQLGLLEKEVFKKSFNGETIPTRLNRLETTVFPQEKPLIDKPLPERVSRLLTAIPISQAQATSPKRVRRGGDPDFPDLDFNDPGSVSTKGSGGGLSKIINGLGNMVSGGYTGSYAATPGTLIKDPSTGLLYDQYTGTLIDPMTGAVVGRRNVQMGGYGGGSSYSGFNSGFSPMNQFGGGGMGFGFGGGGMRFGGMWP